MEGKRRGREERGGIREGRRKGEGIGNPEKNHGAATGSTSYGIRGPHNF